MNNTQKMNKQILIINRHTCGKNYKVQMQCHVLDTETMTVINSYPNIQGDDLSLFNHYDNRLLFDVDKVAKLSVVNFV